MESSWSGRTPTRRVERFVRANRGHATPNEHRGLGSDGWHGRGFAPQSILTARFVTFSVQLDF